MNGILGGGSWRAHLGTVGLVTLITVLIWIWAAGETAEVRNFEARVDLRPTDPQRMRVSPDRVEGNVRIVARGSTRALGRFQDLLAEGPIDLVAGVGGMPSAEGVSPVNLASVLADLPTVRNTGVSLEQVDPLSIEVRIDPLESLGLRVVAELPPGLLQLDGDLQVEPPEAFARLPAALRRETSTLTVLAVPDRRQLEQLEPGTHTLTVALQFPPGLAAVARGAAIDPPTVQISFTSRSRTATTTLASVPVQVAGISGELQRHTVAVQDEFLREVVLSGPPEAIARIDAGQARIVAFVHLDSRDLDRRIETKRVSLWMLPKGVSVQRVGDHEGSDPEVRLSIAPGATTPEPGQLPAALGADSRTTDPRPADPRAAEVGGGEPTPGSPPRPAAARRVD